MKENDLSQLQRSIEEIADKLCLAVKGEFDFTIDMNSTDQSVQKLTMLVNFVLDSARRAILEIKEKNDKLTELDQLKSDFMANISHELRTPLTLILGPLETILGKYQATLPKEILQELQRMQRNSVRLYLLVNDVLDFSKLEAGKFVICEEPLNLNQLLALLVDDALGLARERKLSLEFVPNTTIKDMLFDHKIIEKILLNLISNALKFTPEGGKVTVKLTHNDDTVCIRVSDTGTGIPPEQIPHIFERFHQIDSSSTRAHEGTGIGLALIHQFVALMQGKISIDSEIGKGSTFTITLPFRLPDQTQMSENIKANSTNAYLSKLVLNPGENTASTKITRIEGKKPLLLITDDNPDIRAYISSLLQDSYEIIMAENGALALEAIRSYHPQVILSDVMMPEMDGYQLTQTLKADPDLCHIPIILITAKTGGESITSGLNIGADDYLSKPFSAEELIARTDSALSKYQNYLKNRELNTQLVAVARRVGMADIATSILHNIGNVLNSANVSITMIKEKIEKPHAKNLYSVITMIRENLSHLAHYLTEDPKGKLLPDYLMALGKELNDEFATINQEIGRLNDQIKYIEEIVAIQKTVSGISDMVEKFFVPDLINNAISMCKSSIEKRNITIEKDIKENVFLTTDKNKVLQIIVNLIQNANEALSVKNQDIPDKKISIKVSRSGDNFGVDIIVHDNGIGISEENLNSIFTFGFTTKPQGHGFGLHSSALAAKELGGTLKVESEGLGYGAKFTLTLPLIDPIKGLNNDTNVERTSNSYN